jgi:membrane carboxypeptidase/penicillin-binding protein
MLVRARSLTALALSLAFAPAPAQEARSDTLFTVEKYLDYEQVADPRHAYQMVHMLEGVIQRGTGQRGAAIALGLRAGIGQGHRATFCVWTKSVIFSAH